jgi:hypothetical protein
LRELVTDEHHVVLHFPARLDIVAKASLVLRLASALPEFTVFDSGGSHDTEWITVKKVIAAENVRANEAEFVAALRLFRQTASTLATRLARHLGVPTDHLLNVGLANDRTGWADWFRGLLGRRVRGNRLDREWTYSFHGRECRFENRAMGQIVEVRLGFGTEFGVLDPYFFALFVKSTPALTHLARLLRDDFHDAARVLELLHRAGYLRVVEGRFGRGRMVREEVEPPGDGIALDSLRRDARTEDDWNNCEDAAQMVVSLRASGRASDRQLRLFACACVRRIWHLLPDERSRKALETAEQRADGLLNTGERVALGETHSHGPDARSFAAVRATEAALEVFAAGADDAALRASQYAERAAQYAAIEAASTAENDDWQLAWREVEKVEEAAQVALLHDLFGNPFRPTTFSSAWRTWNDAAVVRLAQAAYEERQWPAGTLDNARLAILADALEEAGCTDTELLTHLRSPGPHVRGCFALDAVLGKS